MILIGVQFNWLTQLPGHHRKYKTSTLTISLIRFITAMEKAKNKNVFSVVTGNCQTMKGF